MKKFSAILLLSLIVPFILSVDATEKNGLGIAPATLEVDIANPEDKKRVEFVIRNHSDTTVSIALQIYDFRPYGEDGNIRFIPRISKEIYQYSLSSFISLETTQLILEPKEEKKVTALIENREDLSPGGHYAALMARDVSEVGANSDTVIQPAVVSTLFIRKVGGERFNLSIKQVDWPSFPVVFRFPSSTTLLFQNAGNVHLVPFGSLNVTDMWGRTVYDGYLNSGSTKVYPESRRTVPLTMQNVRWLFPVSFMSLRINGQDSLKETQYSYFDSFVYINPYVPGIVVIVALVILYRRRLRSILRRKK